MNIQKLECPNCHASLDSDYGNTGIFFCKYCGQKIIVEEIQNAEYNYRIRKMEMELESEKIEFEHRQKLAKLAYEKEKQEKNIKYLLLLLLGVGLMIGFMLIILTIWIPFIV